METEAETGGTRPPSQGRLELLGMEEAGKTLPGDCGGSTAPGPQTSGVLSFPCGPQPADDFCPLSLNGLCAAALAHTGHWPVSLCSQPEPTAAPSWGAAFKLAVM